MYELSRVRLHSIGPKGARYQDVTLDLRCGSSGRPAGASVLFLENGGGKTVLVRLIFSVILPGRRQVVGTSNSKMLEKFVLAGDVAHVALEWQDTRSGNRLVTGKVSEWQGHVVSADSNRLTERWYTFRPTGTLDLGTLPFTQDRRIVSLAGFQDRLDEADKADPSLQVRWVDKRGEWTEHLDSLRLDPELFNYQRKMNAGEGEAADAFTFKTDEAFVDWLLTAIIPDEETRGFGDVVSGYASQLANRGELIAERDFIQGALNCLDPLVHATGERQAAGALHRDALADAERLVVALAGRLAEEAERHRLLSGQLSDVEARERALDQDVRRLNAVVLELTRLVAKLRWDAAKAEREDLERERDDARKLLTAWHATGALVKYNVAHEKAETIREIVRQRQDKAAPLLAARDDAATRLARGLLAIANTAEEEARSADSRADALEEEMSQKADDLEEALRRAEAARARIGQLTQNIREVQAAIQEAVSAGLLWDQEDVADAADIAESTAGEAEANVTKALTRSSDLAAERELITPDHEEARSGLDVKSRAADTLGEQLAAAQQVADELRGATRLTELLGSEEIALDDDAQALIALLHEATDTSEKERDALRLAAATDDRVLDALGSGGLLPPDEYIATVLRVLSDNEITAWSGWEYLARIRADERDQVLVRYPHLIDGVVLNNPDDLDRAREKLAEARILPRTVIAVGTSAAIMEPGTGAPAGVAFIVPPNPAMYDTERAEEERQRIQSRQESRNAVLAHLEVALGADRDLHARLATWQRDFPPGALEELAADHRQAVLDQETAAQRERELREALATLVKEEKSLREQIPGLRTRAGDARRTADALRALASEHAKIAGWQEAIHKAKDEKEWADRDAARHRADAAELGRQQREAHRRADSHRRTVSSCQQELADVVGGGSANESLPVPDEAIESLRAAYRVAATAYEQADTGDDLRSEIDRLSRDESEARVAIEDFGREVQERATGLLLTPDGSDAASRAEATDRTQRHVNALEGRVTGAAENAARLETVYRGIQPQERSLEPYGKPQDIEQGDQLIARATGDRDSARADFEEVQKRKDALSTQLGTIDRLVGDFAVVREALSSLVMPELEREADPFRGTVDAARARRDEVRETLREATRLVDQSTEQVRRAADRLAQHASDQKFGQVAAPVRQQMISTDRERLPDFAADWQTALRPRFRVLNDELERIERHRAMLIERLQGMVKHALGRLRAAQRASKLPADLGDWSELEFLRIAFTPPDDPVLAERLGEVIDEATALSAGKEPGKRDGLSLLLSGVRAALRPKGVRVEMLKPDAVLREERVRVAEISDVFSGGQLLTAAIILYCTMAWLRAGERGQAQRQHAGALFLDNPIGRASAGYLLELQLTVAKRLGVQLVYTTGLFDLNALSVFPLIVRLRNDADLRAGMKYLRLDNEIRMRLPDPVADDTGVLTASRLFVRADGEAL